MNWAEVAARVRRANSLALLLDFDGTLAVLRPRPGRVRLRQPVRRLLARLARHPRVTISIISGRTLRDVRRRARVPGACYLGLHGWEREYRAVSPPKRTLRQLERAKATERARLQGLPGIWLEDKHFGFAVHYRGASPGTTRHAHRAFRSALQPFLSDLLVLEGKKVWEVLPRAIPGKGAAAEALLAELPKSTLPIYVGDDTADESAFRVLRRGITVRVGRSSQTDARFWLRNPEEVWRFLQKMEEELRCGHLSRSNS